MNGDLAGVPPILMFCGSADIVVADARRLAQKAPLGTVEYHEEPGLMHGYVLLFFRESRRAQDRIVAFVEGLWQRGSQVASLASKRSTA